jgi:L-glyceraldehyde 3-phosphate reductase
MSYEAASHRYDDMTYRRCGKSGIVLPEVSLGLWHNFGEEGSYETQRAIIRRAFDRGVMHFDLANNYGIPAGSAEERFGDILEDDLAPYRDELIISTKAGHRMWPGPFGEWGSRKYLLASLDASLERMGLDYVDIFYSHRPDPLTPIEETMGALASAVQQGKALYVGISAYTPQQTVAAKAELDRLGVPLLIHQPRYSMFDRTIEHSGLLYTLDELGVGSIVFSPLAMGMLTDRYLHGVPEGSRAANRRHITPENITPEYLERAHALNAIAAARGQSLAQLALTWVLRHAGVTSALIGASSVAQLDDNLGAVGAPALTSEELLAIDEFAVHGTENRARR